MGSLVQCPTYFSCSLCGLQFLRMALLPSPYMLFNHGPSFKKKLWKAPCQHSVPVVVTWVFQNGGVTAMGDPSKEV